MGCETLCVMRHFRFYTRNVTANISLLIVCVNISERKSHFGQIPVVKMRTSFICHYFVCSEPKENKKKTNPKGSDKAKWVISVSFNQTKQFIGDKWWGKALALAWTGAFSCWHVLMENYTNVLVLSGWRRRWAQSCWMRLICLLVQWV